jgi:alcohol dehydrogenase/alcohol dehydrogenase class-P
VTNLIIFAHVSIFLLGWYRIVESVGEGVTDLKPGDHVLPVFTGECKECRQCKSEESNMCDLLRINTDRGVMLNDGKSRFSIRG